MLHETLKIVSTITLAITVLATFSALLSPSNNSAQAADILQEKKDDSSQTGNKPEDKIRVLLQEMVDNAKEEVGSRMREFQAGRGTTEFLCESSIRLLNAERELSKEKADHLAALQSHLQRMKKVEELNKNWRDQGRTPNKDYALSKYYRLQAEVWLERAKAGK